MRRSRTFRDLSTSRKLAVMAGICLAPALVLSAASVVVLPAVGLRAERLQVDDGDRGRPARSTTSTTATARSRPTPTARIVEPRPSVVQQDTADDIASADEVMAALEALDLPASLDSRLDRPARRC